MWVRILQAIMVAARQLLDVFKGQVVTIIITRLFASSKGLQLWIIKIMLKYGIDKILLPFFNWGLRKGDYISEVIEGKAQIKRKDNARTQVDYDSSVDDIFRT